MGVGEFIFHRLLAQREQRRQYCFAFLSPEPDERPYSLTLETAVATIRVVARDFGRQGVLLESLRLSQTAGRGDEDKATDLMRLVERIVTEVTCPHPYGPIRCVENDERFTRAVLRTDPDGDGCFFEIVVDGGGVVELKHYTISELTRERRQTPVNVGRRVFAKMADQLAGAFGAGPGWAPA